MKEGRFNDANDIFRRNGNITSSVSKDGKVNIKGTVEYEKSEGTSNQTYNYPAKFEGEIEDGKLMLKGNQGPYLDCRVSLQYAGKASE